MKIGYADTSCLVAVALGERGSEQVATALQDCDVLVASNLLEAELRSVLARERVDSDATPLLTTVSWVHPNRSLGPEYETILGAGYLRGADLWHLACAVYLRRDIPSLSFFTLDERQKVVAAKVGLSTWRPTS